MLYLLSNIIAWCLIIVGFGLAVALDYRSFRQPQINIMVLTALLIAVATVLTNLISYRFFILGAGIRLDLGAFLIFVLGMLFGPFWGVIGGVCADNLGLLFGINGAYSAIFTLDKVFYGLMGALVFLGKTNRWWIFKTIFWYSLTFLIISFGFDVIWFYVTFGSAGLVAALILKSIKFWLEIVIYGSLVLIAFSTLYRLASQRLTGNFWAQRLGALRLWLRRRTKPTPNTFNSETCYNKKNEF